ncbi:MAG: glycosyltransferase family 4 protein [Ruminococcus sp.]|nr:glycosyltransferase family 4 protein [Ruminococcus sp.]
MKIFFLTNLLSPYRVEWLNRFTPENEIAAYYLVADEATREKEWIDSQKPHFPVRQVSLDPLTHRLPSKAFLSEALSGGYDIYLIDGYSSLVKLKLLKTLLKCQKTVFINIDGIDVWREKTKADIVKDAIKRKVFRSGAYFLCGSQIAQKTAIENGADANKVFVHPFTSLYQKDIISYEQKNILQKKYKEKLDVADQKIALAVGRFIPLKKYDVLIEAWRKMPDNCRLYIIGGGEERENYERLIADAGITNIELIDFILPEKLSEYFCAADLFVHPSSTETWGLVLNEAMAKGCPVIATDRCVAATELIRDGENGYLIKVGDAETLNRRMREILFDDALREKMGKNAVKTIEPYTYENLAQTHLRIFRDILPQ